MRSVHNMGFKSFNVKPNMIKIKTRHKSLQTICIEKLENPLLEMEGFYPRKINSNFV